MIFNSITYPTDQLHGMNLLFFGQIKLHGTNHANQVEQNLYALRTKNISCNSDDDYWALIPEKNMMGKEHEGGVCLSVGIGRKN